MTINLIKTIFISQVILIGGSAANESPEKVFDCRKVLGELKLIDYLYGEPTFWENEAKKLKSAGIPVHTVSLVAAKDVVDNF